MNTNVNPIHGRTPSFFKSLIFVMAALFVLAACGDLDLAFGPVLTNVTVSPDQISPNADGTTDATEIRYSLARSADVSIFFENAAGARTYFRKERRRSPGDYSVLWGGVVDEPEVRQTEYGTEEILSRVLPDGAYTWTVEAVEDSGNTLTKSGIITLADADTILPELHNFAVVPQVFRPNQDGLRDDWVSISYFLTKDADTVQVYLVDPALPGIKLPIAENPNVVKTNEAGYHEYRYEGGVDLGAEPPKDGTYTIIGEARDLAGNAVRVSSTLTIEEGGVPRADIAQGEIAWEGDTNRVVGLPLGGKLCFTAVVTNEGTVPLRTTGPWPGQEYTFGQNYNTLAAQGHEEWFQQAGVWRFGINFDTTGVDFPFRWAAGRQEDLEMRLIDGVEQWYLMPGTSGQVSGCITIDEKPPVGTTFWWGGLIHEFVSVANNYVDRITVNVGTP
ncbi:MAG: hypothetical protein KBG20_14530 [Caldilineaceae bacterium]|nr:hypothetical protein [Caldilineaceae bacterium]MBP8108362.1 hypothetical protein [Caldilineaceae bacterium]MBP8123287.1 hypothetical protein [Caldilineaceae bacterium]MBP9073519.1 hypothetical protein [Caldilineaceae bacterium]